MAARAQADDSRGDEVRRTKPYLFENLANKDTNVAPANLLDHGGPIWPARARATGSSTCSIDSAGIFSPASTSGSVSTEAPICAALPAHAATRRGNHVLQDSAASPAMGCGASARRADRAVAGDAIPRLQRADMIFGYSRPVPAQPLIAACWRRAGTIRSANLCNRASPTDGLLRGRALGPCRGRSNPYDGDPVGRLRSQQPIGPLFARPRERATAARVRLGDQYRQSSLAFAGDTGSSLRRN
jgi:hypothetical protein